MNSLRAVLVYLLFSSLFFSSSLCHSSVCCTCKLIFRLLLFCTDELFIGQKQFFTMFLALSAFTPNSLLSISQRPSSVHRFPALLFFIFFFGNLFPVSTDLCQHLCHQAQTQEPLSDSHYVTVSRFYFFA